MWPTRAAKEGPCPCAVERLAAPVCQRGAAQGGAGTVDRQQAQVDIAALGDAPEPAGVAAIEDFRFASPRATLLPHAPKK